MKERDYAWQRFFENGGIEHKFMQAIELCEYADEGFMHGSSRYSRVLATAGGHDRERSNWLEHHPGGEGND